MGNKKKFAVVFMAVCFLIAALSVYTLSDIPDPKLENIATAQNRFYPKQNITHMEAAEMDNKSLRFIQNNQNNKSGQDPVEPEDDVSVQVEKVNDQVNKIVLSKSDMPNPGYGIAIDRIEFLPGQKAVAYYHFITPEPGKMYPQVISTAKASFYLDSKYKVIVKRSPGQDELPKTIPGPQIL
ncbi:hypothetical protein [Paenibacillus sp.]|jgi:hypothetical protein|uniref:hypothetical protein n=1 Tax=Paenibacillus sp. TaxID=58172 RepID=UPI0028273E0B|nr:hypothetical protein [Paenibacillus sp.]MDR0266657.1 protease complex subunit PrcB family protein [Paenibacillus sp.]